MAITTYLSPLSSLALWSICFSEQQEAAQGWPGTLTMRLQVLPHMGLGATFLDWQEARVEHAGSGRRGLPWHL